MINNDSSEMIIADALIVAKISDSKIMTDYLCNQFVFDRILEICKRHNPIALRSGLTILITLIKIFSTKETTFPEEYYERIKITIKEIIQHLNNLLLMNHNAPSEYQKSQFGGEAPVLGMALIKVIEFFSILIKLNDPFLADQMRVLKIASTMFKLFDIYYMNSNLHNKVFQFFSEGINSHLQSYIESMTIDINLANMIINRMKEENLEYQNSRKKFWRPNIVFFTKLAELLNTKSKENSLISEYLKKINEWEIFVEKILDPILKRQNQPIPKKEETKEEKRDEVINPTEPQVDVPILQSTSKELANLSDQLMLGSLESEQNKQEEEVKIPNQEGLLERN